MFGVFSMAARRRAPKLPSLIFLPCLAIFACAVLGAEEAQAFDVTSRHYDNLRTGWNAKETELTPARIRSSGFGLLRSITLDEQVDAQPLVLSNVTIGGAPHEVVYVATENNTIYAIDAATGSILIQKSLGAPVSAGAGGLIDCGNNASVIGVTSTPVIDREAGTLYAISFNNEGGQPVYRVHALDLTTLAEKTPSRLVAATSSLNDGQRYAFNPRVSRQRAALVLANGKLYAAFASFCDHNWSDTRGWILGWNAKTLEPIAKSNLTNNRAHSADSYFLTSVWMSGAGPAVDEAGNVYFITGNSDRNQPSPPVDPALSLQESLVKLNGDLSTVVDFFTPSNLAILDKLDDDFGSGSVLLIPGEQPGPAKHLAIAAGKVGTMYLLDRDHLGKFDPSGDKRALASVSIGRCWCGQSYFVGADNVGRVLSSGGVTLSAWKVQPTATPRLAKDWDAAEKVASGPFVFQKGFFTSVSSNGVAPDSAVVWAVQRPSVQPPALALWAFDAKDGSTLVKGAPAGAWPNVGGAANTVPVVANGRVYVASNKELRIFGLGGVQVAARAESVETLAAPTQVRLYGTVVEVDGQSTLWLRTPSRLLRVDIAEAVAKQKISPLVPGRAVLVNGTSAGGGAVKANSIEYAPDNPEFWSPQK